MPLLIIRAGEIRELLTMERCIEAMDRAMRALHAGTVAVPPRTIAPLENGENYFILMPGEMRDGPVYGAKIVGLHPGNPADGRPAVQGFVALFDRVSGDPVALMDGAEITAVRTAAASALATRALSRRDASSHGIFGAGVQAASHLRAIALVRGIGETLVWARDSRKAAAFAREQTDRTGLTVVPVDDPARAAGCDIVSTVTNSPEPVLRGQWLNPGAHLNLVGAHEAEHREVDSEAVSNASIFVDSLPAALSEAGDILIPVSEGRIRAEDIAGEIGAVLAGEVPGRTDEREITLYKSLGNVAQDLFAAEALLRIARKEGLGQQVEFP